jgi:hypothetical protein
MAAALPSKSVSKASFDRFCSQPVNEKYQGFNDPAVVFSFLGKSLDKPNLLTQVWQCQNNRSLYFASWQNDRTASR